MMLRVGGVYLQNLLYLTVSKNLHFFTFQPGDNINLLLSDTVGPKYQGLKH